MERRIGFVVGLKAEARLLRGRGYMIGIGGGGPEGAALAAENLVAAGAQALISFGLAGGLNPDLPPGRAVIPASILEGATIFACDSGLLEMFGGATTQTMLAGQNIAVTVAEKSALFRATKADAIDLESGAVARVAAAHELPFAVLRAVADPANRTLPPAALVALNTAGRIGLLPVLASVARHPGQIPALLALARDAAAARKTLLKRLPAG